MTPRRRGTSELVLAVAALVGAGLIWPLSHRAVAVAPIADGQPGTVSVAYDPQLLLLLLLLATAAGILAVVGTARIRRSARSVEHPGANGPPGPPARL